MIEIANEVEARLRDEGFKKPLKIAIMGCVVNGPGEAREPTSALPAARERASFQKRSDHPQGAGAELLDALMEEIDKLLICNKTGCAGR